MNNNTTTTGQSALAQKPLDWSIQVMQHDGTVIAAASRRPHDAIQITGDWGQLCRVFNEIHHIVNAIPRPEALN